MNRKYVLLRKNSRSVIICGMDMLVLCERSGSYWNFCLTVLMEGSTRTEVKRILHHKMSWPLPGSSFTSLMCCAKWWVYFRWCGDWPTRGWMMLANSLATPYVMDPLLVIMDLRGASFMYFGFAIEVWGNCVGGVHISVDVVTKSSLAVDV